MDTVATRAANIAALAAITVVGQHRQDHHSSRYGRYEAPWYSNRGDLAMCWCGRRWLGPRAFANLRMHVRAQGKRADRIFSRVWQETNTRHEQRG